MGREIFDKKDVKIKNESTESIAKNITISFSALFIIAAVIMAGAFYYINSREYLTKEINNMIKITDEQSKRFSSELYKKALMLQTLALDNKVSTMNRNLQEKTLLNQTKALENTNEKTAFQVSDLSGETYEVGTDITYNLKGKDNFEQTIGENKTVFAPPLISEVTHKIITIITTPIYENSDINGKIVGILGAQYDSAGFNNIIAGKNKVELNTDKNAKLKKITDFDEFSFIIDKTGKKIAHTDVNFVFRLDNDLKKSDSGFNELAKVERTMIKGETGYKLIKIFNKPYIITYAPIKGTDFFLGTAKDKAVVLKPIHDMGIMILISSLIFLILFILLSNVIASRIGGPIRKIIGDIRQFSDGDLSIKIDSKLEGKKDEVGLMAKAINSMAKNLNIIIKRIQEISQNTLGSAKQITTSLNQVSGASREIDLAVKNIAQGATSHAQEVYKVSCDAKDMSDKINDMDRIIKSLDKSVSIINDRKDEGMTMINELRKLSKEAGEFTQRFMSVIKQTNEFSQEIAKSGEMIRAFSEQTNLLALNATIEAARAGESGKGFAVVAGEIKKLAENTSGFTNNISQTISELREKSESAVKSMDEMNKILEKTDSKTAGTYEKFEEISNSVFDIKTFINKVSESYDTVLDGIEQIVDTVSNLSAIAQENAATTQQASASVQSQNESISNISEELDNLNEVAANLEKEVLKFRF